MNKYEQLGIAGEGAYGVVLKCRQKDTNKLVAIKQFKELEGDDEAHKLMQRELRLLKMLNHENIVQMLESFYRKNTFYVVFEFMESSMMTILESSPRGLEAGIVLKLSRQLALALEHCHNHNVLHRDVKPENLLIDPSNHILRLCDFGSARQVEDAPTQAGVAALVLTDYVATRWYRAPELLLSFNNYGKGVDVWALGCVMAELTDGQPLFAGTSDLDQLSIIQKAVGPLTSQQMGRCLELTDFRGVKFSVASQPEVLEKRFGPQMLDSQMQLLRCILQMEPEQRATTTSALRMPWLSGGQGSQPASTLAKHSSAQPVSTQSTQLDSRCSGTTPMQQQMARPSSRHSISSSQRPPSGFSHSSHRKRFESSPPALRTPSCEVPVISVAQPGSVVRIIGVGRLLVPEDDHPACEVEESITLSDEDSAGQYEQSIAEEIGESGRMNSVASYSAILQHSKSKSSISSCSAKSRPPHLLAQPSTRPISRSESVQGSRLGSGRSVALMPSSLSEMNLSASQGQSVQLEKGRSRSLVPSVISHPRSADISFCSRKGRSPSLVRSARSQHGNVNASFCSQEGRSLSLVRSARSQHGSADASLCSDDAGTRGGVCIAASNSCSTSSARQSLQGGPSRSQRARPNLSSSSFASASPRSGFTDGVPFTPTEADGSLSGSCSRGGSSIRVRQSVPLLSARSGSCSREQSQRLKISGSVSASGPGLGQQSVCSLPVTANSFCVTPNSRSGELGKSRSHSPEKQRKDLGLGSSNALDESVQEVMEELSDSPAVPEEIGEASTCSSPNVALKQQKSEKLVSHTELPDLFSVGRKTGVTLGVRPSICAVACAPRRKVDTKLHLIARKGIRLKGA